MEVLKFDLSKNSGNFKILNATNGGPCYRRGAIDQLRTNFEDYKAARIPYARNHDCAIHGVYGGPYSNDVAKIFTDLDADPSDPCAYDFACTDEYILATLDAGTETFFRLGATIEHQIKKHETRVTCDYHKYAEICEHIIRHYNEGWANGYKLGIKYWEIWNEPDLDCDVSDLSKHRTWGGTKEEFLDFFEILAKHLKQRFPDLKIGGPALASGLPEYNRYFIENISRRNVPIDFFSWHIYAVEPSEIIERGNSIMALLREFGYGGVESILNEWNYVKGWTDDFVYSLETIHGMKGAAFSMACISEAQKQKCIDMLMYYDTRPSVFNGAFDFYTYRKLKGYYPLYYYGMFYDMAYESRCEAEPENIYTLCGVDKNGKALLVVTNYSDKDNTGARDVKIDFGREGKYEIYLLDENHENELVSVTSNLEFTILRNSLIMIKEI